MKIWLTLGLFLGFCFLAQAQDTYFQQEVDYKIKVTLHDITHTLTGDIDIKYTNHSPNSLHKIYMHLWPNAYKHNRTAFAQQQILNNSDEFYYAKEKDLGNISELDFEIDGTKASWKYIHPDTPDIAIITLNQPLEPNQSLTIHTPFTVKIPASFSRLGHVETSYQISQWYPKPAVYDPTGWHPIPYLDQGEFYSEFGHYDVAITLPQNYVVGATGVLETTSEKAFLAQKIVESKAKMDTNTLTDDFPASAKATKTIRYTADKVHDFAWFADKRFLVTKDTLQLPSGKIVDTWALFPPSGIKNWASATDYIKRALSSYSEWVGEYPYPQATAVLSALSAGGGMEYPMITVIGKTFNPKYTDVVITHEVGHNWFYGILGSNERTHAWMDEGTNTFYENRYTQKFYGLDYSELHQDYQALARKRRERPIRTPANELNDISYFVSAYSKPATSLKMLEAYVGTALFDQVMQQYYQAWKFKHPSPKDFRQIWESNTHKNLDWFFDDIINTTQTMDYKILKVKEKYDQTLVTVANKGPLQAPLLLYAFQDEKAVDSMIVEGFTGEKTFTFPSPQISDRYDYFQIDPHSFTLDLYPDNNYSFRPKLQFHPPFTADKPHHKPLYFFPAYGWNAYDKNMLGLTLFNGGRQSEKLFGSITPMYSFGAKTITGLAEFFYPIHTQGIFHKIVPRLSARRFSYYQNLNDHYTETYNRIVPEIRFHLREKDWKKNRKRTISVFQEIIQTNQPFYKNGQFKYLDKVLNQYSHLLYKSKQENGIKETHGLLDLEYAQYDNYDLGAKKYLKLSGIYHFHHKYQAHKNYKVGLFGSYFLFNDARYSSSFNNGLVLGSLAASATGQDDYAYRHLYVGRNERDGWAQQIYSNGLKLPALNGPIGHSNDWMAGINLDVDLPIQLPGFMAVRPYFDWVLYGAPKDSESTQLTQLYSGGIQLALNSVQINFPLFNSKELNNMLKQRAHGNYLGRITFLVNLNKLNPKSVLMLDATP